MIIDAAVHIIHTDQLWIQSQLIHSHLIFYVCCAVKCMMIDFWIFRWWICFHLWTSSQWVLKLLSLMHWKTSFLTGCSAKTYRGLLWQWFEHRECFSFCFKNIKMPMAAWWPMESDTVRLVPMTSCWWSTVTVGVSSTVSGISSDVAKKH